MPRRNRVFHVYILASKRNGTLYTGVTSDVANRVFQHREKLVPGFTSKHRICHLVWLEEHATAESAIKREKQIKKWNREWKIAMIEKLNPYWNDLYAEIAG
jgi:putative endonuclease